MLRPQVTVSLADPPVRGTALEEVLLRHDEPAHCLGHQPKLSVRQRIPRERDELIQVRGDNRRHRRAVLGGITGVARPRVEMERDKTVSQPGGQVR